MQSCQCFKACKAIMLMSQACNVLMHVEDILMLKHVKKSFYKFQVHFQGPCATSFKCISRASCHKFQVNCKGLVPYVQGLRAIMFQGLIATCLCHRIRPKAIMNQTQNQTNHVHSMS